MSRLPPILDYAEAPRHPSRMVASFKSITGVLAGFVTWCLIGFWIGIQPGPGEEKLLVFWIVMVGTSSLLFHGGRGKPHPFRRGFLVGALLSGILIQLIASGVITIQMDL